MASGNHDGGNSLGNAMQGECRAGDIAGVFTFPTGIAGRAGAGCHNTGGAGAQIAADGHLADAGECLGDVLQECFGVGVADAVGHGPYQATGAAGAEADAALVHEIGYG